MWTWAASSHSYFLIYWIFLVDHATGGVKKQNKLIYWSVVNNPCLRISNNAELVTCPSPTFISNENNVSHEWSQAPLHLSCNSIYLTTATTCFSFSDTTGTVPGLLCLRTFLSLQNKNKIRHWVRPVQWEYSEWNKTIRGWQICRNCRRDWIRKCWPNTYVTVTLMLPKKTKCGKHEWLIINSANTLLVTTLLVNRKKDWLSYESLDSRANWDNQSTVQALNEYVRPAETTSHKTVPSVRFSISRVGVAQT